MTQIKDKGTKRPWRRWLWALPAALVAAPLIYLAWLPYVPSLRTENPDETPLMRLREAQALRNGIALHTVYEWRDLSEISPHLVHAVLLSEDDQFYLHHGFDMEQIQIALKRDWAHKQYVYGGSTITQQLARSLYLSPKKSLLRKAKEALITVLLERYLTKNRIMELYLNVVEWGPGLYGAEAAAQAYFKKPAKVLTPDEAVALASILPSPRRWSPTSEFAFMARRRTRLYARLRREGWVPAEPSAPLVPPEIARMALEFNAYLSRQDEENAADAATQEPEVTVNEDGLLEPAHSQAPN